MPCSTETEFESSSDLNTGELNDRRRGLDEGKWLQEIADTIVVTITRADQDEEEGERSSSSSRCTKKTTTFLQSGR